MNRSSTSEDGPSGTGQTRVHQLRRSNSDLNSTCTNRRFWLRADHRLQTKEQALRLLLSGMWSMMWSKSSCGNSDMMMVVVEGRLNHVFISSQLAASLRGYDPFTLPTALVRTKGCCPHWATSRLTTRLTTIDSAVRASHFQIRASTIAEGAFQVRGTWAGIQPQIQRREGYRGGEPVKRPPPCRSSPKGPMFASTVFASVLCLHYLQHLGRRLKGMSSFCPEFVSCDMGEVGFFPSYMQDPLLPLRLHHKHELPPPHRSLPTHCLGLVDSESSCGLDCYHVLLGLRSTGV